MPSTMIDFWANLIQPYVLRQRPRAIVVVGGEDTQLVDRLLDSAADWDGVVHFADPPPGCDIAALRLRGLDCLVVHEASGADALDVLAVPDLLLLDVDPNWYSVQRALSAAAAKAARTARHFPVTLLTNTAWPYARRDGYRNLFAVPDSFRHAHETAGLWPGQGALCASFGLFTDRTHANTEFGPRNGVLTALEDFAEHADPAIAFTTLPLLCGISLIHAAADFGSDAVRALRGALAMGDAARALSEAVEFDRLTRASEAADVRRQAAAEKQRNDLLHDALRREQSAMAELRASASAGGKLQVQRRLGALASQPRQTAAAALAKAARAARRLNSRGGERDTAASDAADIARLRASPAFDAQWYLSTYTDVAACGHDPAAHYFYHGGAERRDPGPFFSTDFYLSSYQDVAQSGVNPLLHYLRDGAREGRDPNPSFSSKAYIETQPTAKADDNPLEHYLTAARR